MHAAAYLRRSSVSTDSPGDASREAQHEATSRLAAAFAPGVEIREYTDWGISGRRDDRPAYVQLKRDIAVGEVSHVFAYSLSRLGRTARELDSLFSLCEIHNVAVITQADGQLSAATASGRFTRRILSELAQLESELASERSQAARGARKAAAERAGALLPDGRLLNNVPAYGFRHVRGTDGVIRREHDPEQPFEPIVAAYLEADSVRGAAVLLNARGILAPGGGKTWGSSTLTRVLAAHDACGPDGTSSHPGYLLPERNASGKARHAGKPALFAGLLRCHCGRTLTPNVTRKHEGRPAPGQYYCSGGRDRGRAAHGRYIVTESAIKAGVWAEAARQYISLTLTRGERLDADIDTLLARRERVAAALLDNIINAAKAKAETTAIDTKLQKLRLQSGAITGAAWNQQIDLDGDPAEQNRLLRSLWLRVQLSRDMVPHVEWISDPDAARKADRERWEALKASAVQGDGSTPGAADGVWRSDIEIPDA